MYEIADYDKNISCDVYKHFFRNWTWWISFFLYLFLLLRWFGIFDCNLPLIVRNITNLANFSYNLGN